jgi:hypothetical protein
MGLFVFGLSAAGFLGSGSNSANTIGAFASFAFSILAVVAAVYCWLRDRAAPRLLESVFIGALALAGGLLVLSCVVGGLATLITAAFL